MALFPNGPAMPDKDDRHGLTDLKLKKKPSRYARPQTLQSEYLRHPPNEHAAERETAATAADGHADSAGGRMEKAKPQVRTPSRRVIFQGVTKAYRRFITVAHRTERLLNVSDLGVREDSKRFTSLLDQLKDAPSLRGQRRTDDVPEVYGSSRTADGKITIKMNDVGAAIIKSAATSYMREGKEVPFHFRAVLLVYVWAAFATYITMLLGELFQRRPELLKSENSLTYKEAVSHRESLIGFLAEQQLIRVGKMGLDETLKYLRDRVGLAVDEKQRERLRRFYLLRNVVAHNTGLVSPSLRRSLPAGIRVQSGEVRISRPVLRSMLRYTKHAARTIERQVIRKFYEKGAGSVVVRLPLAGGR